MNVNPALSEDSSNNSDYLGLYGVISSFLKHARGLGWTISYGGHCYEIVKAFGDERTCIYYREWKKPINPGTIERDFYMLREGIFNGRYDYILLIYSPSYGSVLSLILGPGWSPRRTPHLDRLIIFGIDLELKAYSITYYSKGGCRSIVAQEFEKHIRSLGLRRISELFSP